MSMVIEMKLYIKKMDGTVVTYKIDKVCPLDNKILAFELNKKLTLEYELTYSYEVWWLLIRLKYFSNGAISYNYVVGWKMKTKTFLYKLLMTIIALELRLRCRFGGGNAANV